MHKRNQEKYDILIQYVRTGILEIDDMGRVFRLVDLRTKMKTHTRIDILHHTGYRMVLIKYKSRTISCMAHTLIWNHHHGPVPDGLVINHIDGNGLNNVITNLEVVTQKENMHHAIHVLGTKKVYGTTNPNARLKLRDIARIFWWYGHGVPIREIAARLSRDKGHVRDILKRRYWKKFI